MTLMKSRLLAATAVLGLTVGAAAAEDVEVLHWWTSGGEAAALNVLKDDLGRTGHRLGRHAGRRRWRRGGDDRAARPRHGRQPADRRADAGLRHPGLGGGRRAGRPDRDRRRPRDGTRSFRPRLQAFSKYDGKWIAAPVNVHSTNWVWINKAALDAAGGKAPETWDELVAVLDAMKANGITPLAHGGQAWQDATIFDAVVLCMGPDFYKASMIDLDPGGTRRRADGRGLQPHGQAARAMSTTTSRAATGTSPRRW